MERMLRVHAVPAAAQLASGEVFGHDQPLALHLLGSERSAGALEGVAMELEDSLYPLLREVPPPTHSQYQGLHSFGSLPRDVVDWWQCSRTCQTLSMRCEQ